MKKWYWQILSGFVILIAIAILNEAIYPEALFPTPQAILASGDARGFYIMAVFGLVAQVLILVGLVRGILALIRKFRSFVRISK